MLSGAESIGILAPDFVSQIAASAHAHASFKTASQKQISSRHPTESASLHALEGRTEWAAFGTKVANDIAALTRAINSLTWSLWLNPSNPIHYAEIRRRILHLCTYNAPGTTSAVSQDQANRDIMMSLAMAFDVIKTNLTISERTTVLSMIRARGLQVYNGGSEIASLLKLPYDSHGDNTLGYLACTSIITVGEIPEADKWLNETLPMYIALYSTWGTEDGGFGNGLGYAVFDATDSRWEWMRNGAGVNLVGKQWLRNWPLQFIYFIPPYADSVGVGFGDSGEQDQTGYRGIICGSLFSRVLADKTSIISQSQRDLLLWYCDRVKANTYNDYRYYIYLWVSPFPAVPKLTDTAMNAANYPQGIHLRQIGWVAMHSTLFSPNRTSLYFRSGPFGSYNHNNADQLCFTLSHRGKSFLIASGYYDYYGSVQHYNWRKHTRAQSGGVTLTNDQGQRTNSFTAVGTIKQFYTSTAFDAVTGSATDAYNDGYGAKQVTRATRSIIYLRSINQYIIQDQFDSPSPQTWSWNFHAYKNMTLLSPQTDLFPANAGTELPNQFHAKWQMWSPTTSFALVVVIDPDCTNIIVSTPSVPLPKRNFIEFRWRLVIPQCWIGKKRKEACLEGHLMSSIVSKKSKPLNIIIFFLY
ncbi:hypothetical protein HDU79_005692 [Rhizoclosmatium sp. JEL0117]|nr:hypothetical protein HDU79_005692 [Rhizoclosmatium sp. JEL0117]